MKLSPRPRAAALAVLVSAVNLHCDGSGAARGSSRGDEAGALDGPSAQSSNGARGADGGSVLRAPRRPSRSYVLAHGKDRCVVVWEDGDERSEPQEVRCPRELEAGERIRLIGRVCVREGAGHDRTVPVRCPTDLVARELADRHDAGLK